MPADFAALGSTPAAAGPAAQGTSLRAPSLLHLLGEARAPWEFGAALLASPLLRHAAKGDGHPVLVYPGLAANDLSTVPLRNFLRERGYTPYPWNFGFNLGPRSGVLRGCAEHVRELAEKHGRKVSLLGWSLGGLYAREVAKLVPELVRTTITLGTPFTGHAKANNAWRLYEWVSETQVEPLDQFDSLREPPPVPTTSIYSRSDGVVAWQCCLNTPTPMAENIEVNASHFGLGGHPAVLFAIADRLAQPENNWRPFERDGMRKWFFRAS